MTSVEKDKRHFNLVRKVPETITRLRIPAPQNLWSSDPFPVLFMHKSSDCRGTDSRSQSLLRRSFAGE
ncbi:hypothetical protein ACFX12_030690 [Malus domestica]